MLDCMLDFYLNKINSDNVVLFAENCVGQNKNNAILHYLLSREITKKKKELVFKFLIAGTYQIFTQP